MEVKRWDIYNAMGDYNGTSMRSEVSGDYVRHDDHLEAMAEKDRELADTKAALAAVRAQLEADPQVREFTRKAMEDAQARLAALEWKPITPENLPKVG